MSQARSNQPKRGQSKQRQQRSNRPVWLMPAIIGGGIAALLLLVAVTVGLLSLLKGGTRGGSGGAGHTINVSRDPESGQYSWVPNGQPTDADAAGWKVTVDGITPAAGLMS